MLGKTNKSMSKEFFKKFTEDTNVKLELYKDYLTEWLPVFISTSRPFKKCGKHIGSILWSWKR